MLNPLPRRRFRLRGRGSRATRAAGGGAGITSSMSRRANYLDNAVAESWFSTLKLELGSGLSPRWRCSESCSTTSRGSTTGSGRHSAVGYCSPVGFERRPSQQTGRPLGPPVN